MVKVSDNNIKFLIGEKSLENLAYEIRLAGCDKPMLVCDDMARRLGYKSILLKAFDGTDTDINYIDHSIGDIATTNDCEKIVYQKRERLLDFAWQKSRDERGQNKQNYAMRRRI